MRTILITGATDGIGAVAAKALAKEVGNDIIIHGRSEAKCELVVKEIQAQGGSASSEIADFSSLTQVRAMADRLTKQNKKIDVILNNAGVWINERKETEDGFELTWQVNYLAPFLLTVRLLPTMLECSDAPRVINISSSGHRSGRLNFDDINQIRSGGGFNGLVAYCQSKLANVLFTQELARRTKGTSLRTYAVDPGAVKTKLLATTGFNVPSAKSSTEEETVGKWLDAVLGPLSYQGNGNQNNGGYFEPNGRLAEPSTRDPELAARLWLMSEKQTAI